MDFNRALFSSWLQWWDPWWRYQRIWATAPRPERSLKKGAVISNFNLLPTHMHETANSALPGALNLCVHVEPQFREGGGVGGMAVRGGPSPAPPILFFVPS